MEDFVGYRPSEEIIGEVEHLQAKQSSATAVGDETDRAGEVVVAEVEVEEGGGKAGEGEDAREAVE